MLCLAEEPREDREAGDGQRDQAPDRGAEAEGRTLEEDAARHGVVRDLFERDPVRISRRRLVAPLGLDDDRLTAELGGRFSCPEDREDDCDRGADRGDQQRVDDEPDEEDDDPDRKADRIQRRRRQMRLLGERLVLGVGTRLLGLHQVEVLSHRPVLRREN